MNLKQERMHVKEYILKFTYPSYYTLDLVYNINSRMKKFFSCLFNDLVFKCKGEMPNCDIDISTLVVYIQQMEDENNKKVKVKERRNKEVYKVHQDAW